MYKNQVNHRAQAIQSLNRLREPHFDYQMYIRILRMELKESDLTPEDIGTSDVEIEELRVKCCKATAIFWLNSLRKYNSLQYGTTINDIRQRLNESGLTLEDIGTSETEIEELWVKCCKATATSLLSLLRDGTLKYAGYIADIRQRLNESGLTPEDIGTSETEIEELRVKCCKAAATSLLWGFRESTISISRGSDISTITTFIGFLYDHLRAGGLTPEDIGSSDVEIEGFKNVA